MPEIPAEILARLNPIAAANGIDLGLAPEGSELPDEKPIFAAVNLNRAYSEVAHETGLNLKTSGLYLFGGTLVTIKPDGTPLEMDGDRFRTWIDQFQLNYYKRRKKSDDDDSPAAPIKATMKADMAKVLLRTDEFLAHIPEIERILPVRLPVFDDSGDVRTVRVLPYGYDPETRIFTANTGIDHALDWDLEKAVAYLRELLGEFPFAELDPGRSLAVMIAAMLTPYCQLLFAERDRLPMIFFNANIPGSGKSRLAEMCIYPIYGQTESLDYAENDEFKKGLDSWAQQRMAYTFFDDVSGLVKSNVLNRWLTSPTWSWRIMHAQKLATMFQQSLVLLTGNQATLSDDLGRRALVVDLWSAELARDRQARLSKIIDAEWLASPDNRRDMLSAFHALLMHWITECEAAPYRKLIPSFEGWSRILPAIVVGAGFECPLQAPNLQDAGQKQEVEFVRMLELAVKDYEPQLGQPVELRLHQWAALARAAGVFHGILGDASQMREYLDANPKYWKTVYDDGGVERPMKESDRERQAFEFLDKSTSTKFGGMLHKFYRGQVRTIDGRRYKFADRAARHSIFTLELLKPAD